ncbi:MAG: histidinol-phosphatase [Sphaerochaetaceae bacterium]
MEKTSWPLSNYHTHCYLDDGNGPLEEYVTTAIEKGFTALGFSCHTPVSPPDEWHMKQEDFIIYAKEVFRLKEKYSTKIELYLSLEFDYLDDTQQLLGSEYEHHLDYTIGAVHCIKHNLSDSYLTVDGPIEEFDTLLQDNFSSNIKDFVAYYYDQQIALMRQYDVDVLAHCDLIKKPNANNRYFDPSEKWYQELTFQFLKEVKQRGTRLEINTGALARKTLTEVYPSIEMLKMCKVLDIPLLLSSDAHNKEHIDFAFDSTCKLLLDIGITSLDAFIENQWNTYQVGSR